MQQCNRINSEGDLIITCQEERSQAKNRDTCIRKLQFIVDEASVEPKEREIWGDQPSEKGKEIRRKDKSFRAEVKSSRKRSSKDFDD